MPSTKQRVLQGWGNKRLLIMGVRNWWQICRVLKTIWRLKIMENKVRPLKEMGMLEPNSIATQAGTSMTNHVMTFSPKQRAENVCCAGIKGENWLIQGLCFTWRRCLKKKKLNYSDLMDYFWMVKDKMDGERE